MAGQCLCIEVVVDLPDKREGWFGPKVSRRDRFRCSSPPQITRSWPGNVDVSCVDAGREYGFNDAPERISWHCCPEER